MIGTIRKHSGWLWGIIITATVISFIFWNAGPSRTGGGGGRVNDNFGSLYGHKITMEAFRNASREVDLYYFFNYHTWPDKEPNLTPAELDRQTYARLMLIQKGEDMGIHVGDETAEQMALQLLRSPSLLRWMGVNGQEVPFNVFLKQVLQPERLTADDFKHFVQHDLVIEQVQQVMGLTGELITPQEAAAAYQRDHQELSAQIVLFSASNYLSQVTVTPAAVAQFYTNYLAVYRLPDRVQVSYVAFEATNFSAEAEQKLSKTNLNEQVEAVYHQYGAKAFPNAKTPAEAKADIREAMIRQQALADAHQQAKEFAGEFFDQEPPRPENLAAAAKQKGLAVHLTAPFAGDNGPEEFTAPAAFTRAAFQLTPDEPFAGPIVGQNAVYVMAFARQLPSEIPSLDQIRARVSQDYQLHEATLLAQGAGTNFVRELAMGLAGGKNFTSVCTAAGVQPQVLPPLSLSTHELRELGDRINLNQLKQAAFSTPVGKTSDFETTSEGGFVVYVQSQLPFDKTEMYADLPQFTALFRHRRLDEAFNEWLQSEANRELRNTPLFSQQQQALPGAKHAPSPP